MDDFLLFLLVEQHVLNVVCIMGLFLNCITMITFLQSSLRTRAVAIYQTTLTVSDILLVSTAWPVLVLNPLLYEGIMSDEGHWHVVIPICYSLMNVWKNACILLTVVATHERYLAVCYPVYHLQQNCAKRAKTRLVCIVALCVLYNIPKIWLTTRQETHQKELQDTTENKTLHSGIDVISDLRLNMNYIVFYRLLGDVLIGSIVPICCLVVMSVRMVRVVSGSGIFSEIVSKAKKITSGLSSSTRENYVRMENTAIPPEKQKQRIQVCHMITYHVIKFAVAYSLPTVCDVMEIAHKFDNIEDHATPMEIRVALITVGNFLVLLNSSSNFVLYFLFCKDFRDTLRSLLSKLIQCLPHSHRGGEQTQALPMVEMNKRTYGTIVESPQQLESSRMPRMVENDCS